MDSGSLFWTSAWGYDGPSRKAAESKESTLESVSSYVKVGFCATKARCYDGAWMGIQDK